MAQRKQRNKGMPFGLSLTVYVDGPVGIDGGRIRLVLSKYATLDRQWTGNCILDKVQTILFCINQTSITCNQSPGELKRLHRITVTHALQ